MANLAELALQHWLAEEEAEIERVIIKAREYHDGEQFIYLSDRLREFISVTEDAEFNINIVRGIVEAITEKLIVKSFKCADEVSAAFAWKVWTSNGMPAKQVDIHDMACRDRESFLFVNYNEAGNSISLIPHQRYTDAQFNGDNEGMKAFYENDDINQRLLRISKRWIEYNESGQARQRLTVYYPDRIEKYEMRGGQFLPVSPEIMQAEGDTGWPLPWVDALGQPLGIPIVHFVNHGYRQEARDAWPLQDAANKTLIDLIASADVSAFRIYKAFGFYPTTDGQPLADDNSNAMNLAPGMIVGSKQEGGTFDAIEGADPSPLVNILQQLIFYSAMVTRTPTSRYQISGLVAAEGTLKQQQESLLAKVKIRHELFGSAWAQIMTLARRLWNTFADGPSIDEAQSYEVLWENPEPRDRNQELQALQIEKDTLQIPLPMLWRKAGYTDQDIKQMMIDREDEMAMRLRVATSDLSVPLVGGQQQIDQEQDVVNV